MWHDVVPNLLSAVQSGLLSRMQVGAKPCCFLNSAQKHGAWAALWQTFIFKQLIGSYYSCFTNTHSHNCFTVKAICLSSEADGLFRNTNSENILTEDGTKITVYGTWQCRTVILANYSVIQMCCIFYVPQTLESVKILHK